MCEAVFLEGGAQSPGAPVRIGTWNISGWSAAKAAVVAQEVDVDILAV